jgi:ERCC4-type nuclease
MKIIIDERETSLYELCLSHENYAKDSFQIEKRVLQLGDILFTNDDETVTYVCIERKSLQDLLASIKDGRYSEQSYRLSNCYANPHNVIYLLEGMLTTVKDKKTVISCIASLNYFKGFSVHRTVSMAETALYILCMADKLAREFKKGTLPRSSSVVAAITSAPSDPTSDPAPLGHAPSTPLGHAPSTPLGHAPSTPLGHAPSTPLTTDYCNVVKACKKANVTKENIGQMMLMQIPGISSTIANELMRPFSSFIEFVDHIRATPEYLTTVTINKRKIGSNIVSSIREYIL